MLRPPVGKQPCFVAIGAKFEVGDGADARFGQPFCDITGQIEMWLAGIWVVGKEGAGLFVLRKEALDILGSDLIGLLRDRGTDCRGDATGPRAESRPSPRGVPAALKAMASSMVPSPP